MFSEEGLWLVTSKGKNGWLVAVIASIGLNAGIINLSYFIGGGNTLVYQLFLGLVAFLILFRIKAASIEIVTVSAIALSLIVLFNFLDPTSIITNPSIPILGLMTFLAGSQLQTRNQKTLERSAILFVTLQLAFQGFFNLDFSPIDSFTGRSKGYGSGTTYALMAATLLVYLTSMLSRRRLHPLAFCALTTVPVWTIFLTQSRGVLLSLIIILVLRNLVRMRSFFKLLAMGAAAALVFGLNPHLVDSVPIFNRLQIGDQLDLNAYSSGRIDTQIVIINWILTEPSIISLFLGAEGLNGIKTLVSQGLQFPHFDLLYLAYDTGLVGAGLYLLLAWVLLVRTRFDSYVLLFFLSALHTNMVLSPAFLLLSIVLHHVNRQKLKIPVRPSTDFDPQFSR